MIGITNQDVALYVIVEENEIGVPVAIHADARTPEEARARLRHLRANAHRRKTGKTYTAYRRAEP